MWIIKKLWEKLNEPSTWKGMTFILSLAGFGLSQNVSDALVIVGPQVIQGISVVITGCLGLWEIWRKENAAHVLPKVDTPTATEPVEFPKDGGA